MAKGSLENREEVYATFRACMDALGNDLDILVTAHGVQRRSSAEVFPLEHWDLLMNMNLNVVFILCQEAAKVMLPQGLRQDHRHFLHGCLVRRSGHPRLHRIQGRRHSADQGAGE